MPLVFERGRAVHLFGHKAVQCLGYRHHIGIIRVRLIEFEHGKFGIVRAVDALVAKIFADFIHALEPAHDQPLEVQFIGDPQIQGHVQHMVMRDKRTRGRAAVQRLQHRGFDFQKPAGIQKFAHRRDDGTALAKRGLHIGIEREVEVAAAIAQFFVAEWIVDHALAIAHFFFGHRQRANGFGQQRELSHLHGDVPGARFEDRAGDADEIADVEQLPQRERLVAHDVEPDVNLKAALGIPQIGKGRFSMTARDDQPPRHLHLVSRRAQVVKRRGDIHRMVRGFKAIRVRLDAHVPNGVEFLHALFDQRLSHNPIQDPFLLLPLISIDRKPSLL